MRTHCHLRALRRITRAQSRDYQTSSITTGAVQLVPPTVDLTNSMAILAIGNPLESNPQTAPEVWEFSISSTNAVQVGRVGGHPGFIQKMSKGILYSPPRPECQNLIRS